MQYKHANYLTYSLGNGLFKRQEIEQQLLFKYAHAAETRGYSLCELNDFWDQPLASRYMVSLSEVLSDFERIKANPTYVDFLSAKLNLNLKAGFGNLEKTGLHVKILPLHKTTDHGGKTKNHPINMMLGGSDANDLRFGLSMRVDMLEKMSKQDLKTTIAHEMGHMLVLASCGVGAPDSLPTQQLIQAGSGGSVSIAEIDNAWHNEYLADKIAAASDQKNDVGSCLNAIPKDIPLVWNLMRSKLPVPRLVSSALAGFCSARDRIINKADEKIGLRIPIVATLTNLLFVKNTDMMHPPAIARAIETEKFATKCDNFLKNQKS